MICKACKVNVLKNTKVLVSRYDSKADGRFCQVDLIQLDSINDVDRSARPLRMSYLPRSSMVKLVGDVTAS